jgi:hypothetical protein
MHGLAWIPPCAPGLAGVVNAPDALMQVTWVVRDTGPAMQARIGEKRPFVRTKPAKTHFAQM